MTTCRGCGRQLEDEAAEACAVDACPLCAACWERLGYAPHHSEADILATSLLANAPRWPAKN